MIKFEVSAGTHAGACAAEESFRFQMASVVLIKTGDDARLIATDGKVLSVIPVTVEGELNKPIALPPDALKANGKPAKLEVNGEVRKVNGKKTEVFPLPEQEGRFPPVKDVFPAASALDDCLSVVLDVNHLARLAKALSCDGQLMVFVQPHRGKPNGTLDDKTVNAPLLALGMSYGARNGSMGLLMPMGHGEHSGARAMAQEAYAKLRDALPNEAIRLDTPTPEVPGLAPEVAHAARAEPESPSPEVKPTVEF